MNCRAKLHAVTCWSGWTALGLGMAMLTSSRGFASEPAGSVEDARAASEAALAKMVQEDGYGLPRDKDLIRVKPPFASRRMEYYYWAYPSQASAIPEGPSAMVFRWNNKGRLRTPGMNFSGDPTTTGYTLVGILDSLCGIKSQEIEGPSDLLAAPCSGDWVVREGASNDELVNQLATILREQLALPVRMEFREAEREVYVASGQYKWAPLASQSQQTAPDDSTKSDQIEIYGKQIVPDSGAGGGCGNFEKFLDWLGRWINAPVVSDVRQPPAHQLCWHLHERSPSTLQTLGEDHAPSLVLANISAQTGLTFKAETRRVRILFVERTE